MGRFASTVKFYARYREPYPAKFFTQIKDRLELKGDERLLDVGCGPGPLALGLAPFVGSCTGIDPEPNMISEAEIAAAKAGVSLTLIRGYIEEFSATDLFDVITIGRALHWMDRTTTLEVLERITSKSGHILICGAQTLETPESPWVHAYDAVRLSWSSDPNEKRHRVDGKAWFAGSKFDEVDTISVAEDRDVSIAELVGRALSKSSTSPAMLGNRRTDFEAEIIQVLTPFAKDGLMKERIVAKASVFARV